MNTSNSALSGAPSEGLYVRGGYSTYNYADKRAEEGMSLIIEVRKEVYCIFVSGILTDYYTSWKGLTDRYPNWEKFNHVFMN